MLNKRKSALFIEFFRECVYIMHDKIDSDNERFFFSFERVVHDY